MAQYLLTLIISLLFKIHEVSIYWKLNQRTHLLVVCALGLTTMLSFRNWSQNIYNESNPLNSHQNNFKYSELLPIYKALPKTVPPPKKKSRVAFIRFTLYVIRRASFAERHVNLIGGCGGGKVTYRQLLAVT